MRGREIGEAQEMGMGQFTQVQERRVRNSNIIPSVAKNLFTIRCSLSVLQKLLLHLTLPPTTVLNLTCPNYCWVSHTLPFFFKGQSHFAIQKPWRNGSVLFFLNLVCHFTFIISFDYVSSLLSLISQSFSTVVYVKLVLCLRHWINGQQDTNLARAAHGQER